MSQEIATSPGLYRFRISNLDGTEAFRIPDSQIVEKNKEFFIKSYKDGRKEVYHKIESIILKEGVFEINRLLLRNIKTKETLVISFAGKNYLAFIIQSS